MSAVPLWTFLAIVCLHLLGEERVSQARSRSWKGDFLLASAFTGAVVVGVTELLGQLSILTPIVLSAAWLTLVAIVLVYSQRSGRLGAGWHAARDLILRADAVDLVLLGVAVLLFGVLTATALAVPQNNVDVMQYHMPRVLQWAQSASLDHFPTIYDNQNTRPYWAELVVLNLRPFWGGDLFASFAQIFALLGAMVAAAATVSLLGGGRGPQWAAALFTFSIPMAVLQATTAKNDIAVGFWFVTLVYFVVLATRRPLNRVEMMGLGSALGLGMLTKGTFMPFAFPLMVLFFGRQLLRDGFRAVVVQGLAISAVVLALNGSFWYRNFATYGGPFGSNLPVGAAIVDPVAADKTLGDSVQQAGPSEELTGDQLLPSDSAVVISHNPQTPIRQPGRMQGLVGTIRDQLMSVLRMALMNSMTPVSFLNSTVIEIMEAFPSVFDRQYLTFLRGAVWNYAMTASNPLHFLILVSSGLVVLVSGPRRGFGVTAQLAVVAAVGYSLLSFAQCSDWLVCLRYQMPVMMIGGVFLGSALAGLSINWSLVLAAIFVLYSLPYVLMNNMRPVIGRPPWPTRIESVFSLPDSEILFAQVPFFQDEYQAIADRIRESGCRDVGLILEARDFEYALWWLLEVPESGIRIQHLRTSSPTQGLGDPGFNACAIVCTICSGSEVERGLPLISDYGHVQYFARADTP